MIKLSIITPTYNRCEYMEKNIRSVQDQIFKNIEHIIIDNMSNDGSEELIRNYQKNASFPVIYIRESDKGIYNAMNKGINSANGEWLHFLNSDDIYINNNILQEIFSNNINEYDVISGHTLLGESLEKNKLRRSYYNEKWKYFGFKHQGTFIKKSFFEKYGLFNEKYKISSDRIYFLKYFKHSKYLLIDKPLVFQFNVGISSTNIYRLIFEKIIVIIFYSKMPLHIKIKKIIKNLYSIKYAVKKSLKKK